MESTSGQIDRRQEQKMAGALLALCGSLLLLSAALNSEPRTRPTGPLPDLSEAQFVEIRDASGHPLLMGEFRTRTDPMGNVEKDAALADPSGAKVIGEIEIDIPRADASDPRQELEVDIIRLTPNATLRVFVNDRHVATFTTDDRGSVDFEIQ